MRAPRRPIALFAAQSFASAALALEGGALVLAVPEVRIWAIGAIEPGPRGGGT